MTSSDSLTGHIVRRATPADLLSIGRLGALLIEEHQDFDPQRFMAEGPGTPVERTEAAQRLFTSAGFRRTMIEMTGELDDPAY